MKDNLSRRRKTLKINHKHSGRLGSMALTGNQSKEKVHSDQKITPDRWHSIVLADKLSMRRKTQM